MSGSSPEDVGHAVTVIAGAAPPAAGLSAMEPAMAGGVVAGAHETQRGVAGVAAVGS